VAFGGEGLLRGSAKRYNLFGGKPKLERVIFIQALEQLYDPGFKTFCRKHGISLAILFGSQAAGRALRGSDLDLAVWVEQPELLLDIPEAARARRRLLRDLS
jgi:predicted nucleotidyltransferase